jgi:HD-GYP domain-containing protein (c-di-GMP phosphodiesterase class II)
MALFRRRRQRPLEAAIVDLADASDAMTTDRPYHRALTVQEALAEVARAELLRLRPRSSTRSWPC